MTREELQERMERIKALREHNLSQRRAIVTFNERLGLYQIQYETITEIEFKFYKKFGSVKRFIENHTLEESQVTYNV